MKKAFVLGIVLLCLSCSGRQTTTSSEDKYNFAQLQTKVREYYQHADCDSVHETDDLISFACLGIAGCTLSVVMQKYGFPIDNNILRDYKSGDGEGSLLWHLSSVLKAVGINNPIDAFELIWTPHENKDLVVTVFFIAADTQLIAVSGEQKNRAIYLME